MIFITIKFHLVQVRTLALKWSHILGYSILPESHVFLLKFVRGDSERELSLISMFAECMYEVCERIGQERGARKEAEGQNGEERADSEQQS